MQLEFSELKTHVIEAGLYKRVHVKYLVHFTGVILGIIGSVFMFSFTQNVYIHALNGIFLGFVLVQAAMLGHDLSHQQVFKNKKYNRFCAAIMWGLFGGLSEAGWYEKHNAHHKHVNQDGLDPDLGVPFIFSEKQVSKKSVFVRNIIQPHQHVLFFLILPFAYSTMVLWSIRTVFSSFTLKNIFDAFLIIGHFVLLIYVPLMFLPFWTFVVFSLTMFFTIGVYMGISFAPNHKGEDVLPRDEEHTWIHQIILTRNIKYSPFTFYFFGGLDLQIEHHLFPDMPRYNYHKAQKFVKAYCAINNLSYHETTWLESMREIYTSLKENRV